MAREIKLTVCSGCIEEFPDGDLYTVTRYMNRSLPEKTNMYSTPYCEKCIKNDKDSYVDIKLEPKNVLKERAKLEKEKQKKKTTPKKKTKK
jgi:hypothetical protein|tara:strand:- start:434 stop:706 length:273 start_codon:yes stop_codon:yes gene_type:complete